MALLSRKSEEEKAAQAEVKATEEERARAEAAAAYEARAAQIANLTKWEYKVQRVGGDKQKGILGGGRMEELFNNLGQQGWELVDVNMERATFKRPRPS